MRIRLLADCLFGAPGLGDSGELRRGDELEVVRAGNHGCVWVDVDKGDGRTREGILYPGEFEVVG